MPAANASLSNTLRRGGGACLRRPAISHASSASATTPNPPHSHGIIAGLSAASAGAACWVLALVAGTAAWVCLARLLSARRACAAASSLSFSDNSFCCSSLSFSSSARRSFNSPISADLAAMSSSR